MKEQLLLHEGAITPTCRSNKHNCMSPSTRRMKQRNFGSNEMLSYIRPEQKVAVQRGSHTAIGTPLKASPWQNGHRNRNIAVRGTFLPLPFRSFSLAFLANRSRRGLTLKSRQRTEQVVIEHVRYSVAPSGLSIVDAFVPGVFTPVCGLSHLRRFSPDTNKTEIFNL